MNIVREVYVIVIFFSVRYFWCNLETDKEAAHIVFYIYMCGYGVHIDVYIPINGNNCCFCLVLIFFIAIYMYNHYEMDVLSSNKKFSNFVVSL